MKKIYVKIVFFVVLNPFVAPIFGVGLDRLPHTLTPINGEHFDGVVSFSGQDSIKGKPMAGKKMLPAQGLPPLPLQEHDSDMSPILEQAAKEDNVLVMINKAIRYKNIPDAIRLIDYAEEVKDEFGVNINAAFGKLRQTLLHIAIQYGLEAIVDRLLAFPGINVQAQDLRGRTPLHYATYNIHHERGGAIVNHLLRIKGINKNASDITNQTPLDVLGNGYRQDIRPGITNQKEREAMDKKMSDKIKSIMRLLKSKE